MYRLLFFLLFVSQCIYCQSVKINKVIDSNLFELKDGRLIKLAGIDIPRLDNPDYLLRKDAQDAVSFAREKLTKKRFSVKIVQQADSLSFVYLIEKYPFGDKIYNLEFLREGFGKFINNIDTTDLSEFTYSEEMARKEKRNMENTR